MPNAFSDLAALEAHFRARGFVDQNGLADQDTEDFYSRVLVPEDERPYLLTVHIMSGEAVGHLEAGLTAYFDPPQRDDVNADLASLAGALVTGGPGADEVVRFLRAALDERRDDERDVEDIRLQVVFPEREPDQTFEVVHIEASRPLSPGEWAGIAEEDNPGQDAIDACRQILRERGHPLAERPLSLTMSSEMGDDRLDVLRTDEGASLWLTTRPKGGPKLSVISPDGTREDL
ncbi:hypothetical protein [Methylopila sp. M107]|uniref:hypothetical protein n=1 Tax=Methylopila sp. M107 TaxID=1101190 RepID=UPI00036B3EBF|nr:hypothetical protein [Methylopila sp. M107]